MQVLRLLVTALLAAFAVMAGLFLAALVFCSGLIAAVLQGFRRKAVSPGPQRGTVPEAADRPGRTDDVIDVIATQVPTDRGDEQR